MREASYGRETTPVSLEGLGATLPAGWLVLFLAALVTPSSAVAQLDASEDPFDPGSLGRGPYEEMIVLMEVTIFKIDVLTLTVRIGPEDGQRLRALIEGRSYSDALADSVAALILDVDDAWARQVLERDVGFGRLLGGIRETSRRAVDAGFITEAYYHRFSDDLPRWFAFLEDDGAKKGDEIVFRIRGDTLRTLYRTVDGEVLLDETGVDAEGRRGSIPSFFAPKTRFRKRLVESLLDQDAGRD